MGRRGRRRSGEDSPGPQTKKGGRRPGGPAAVAEPEGPAESRPSRPALSRASRTEARDEAARAQLEPLEDGERPRAVTVGAVVAVVFAVGNIVAWFVGVRGEGQPFAPVAVLAVLLLVTGWGMWRARYWAVLGMEALLGLSLLTVGLFILLRANWLEALIFTAVVVVPGGALFWFLVKAMARIQMPQRR